ncbi:MAG TPA: hypothetical protein VJI32_08005 [Candidatus Nanoarchaeia archaeon]|nr:hypothetical protein [Candidatus Nanoarchaeia archaeon]
MDDRDLVATFRKIGSVYELEIPGYPLGVTRNIRELYQQLVYFQRRGFTLVEDANNPTIHLNERLH